MKIRRDFVTNSSSTGYVLVLVEMKDGTEYAVEREYDTGYGGYFWDGNTRSSLNAAMKKIESGKELLELLEKKIDYFDGFMIRDDPEGTGFRDALMAVGSRADFRRIRLEEETQYEDGSKMGLSYDYSFDIVEKKKPKVSTINVAVTGSALNGAVCCLTGDFNFGSKKDVENYIVSLGGSCSSSVTAKTNKLIIGAKGSDNYSFGSYGKKYLAAKARQDAGADMEILTEEEFFTKYR